MSLLSFLTIVVPFVKNKEKINNTSETKGKERKTKFKLRSKQQRNKKERTLREINKEYLNFNSQFYQKDWHLS